MAFDTCQKTEDDPNTQFPTFDDLQKPVCHSARRCGISDTTRQNKKRDARFREHDMKLLSFHGHTYRSRPYRALFTFCSYLLPRFRPDGAFIFFCKSDNFFILLLKEAAFDACQKTEDDLNTRIPTFNDLQKPVCHSARRCGISDTTRHPQKTRWPLPRA